MWVLQVPAQMPPYWGSLHHCPKENITTPSGTFCPLLWFIFLFNHYHHFCQFFQWWCFVTNHPSISVISNSKPLFSCSQINGSIGLAYLGWTQLRGSASVFRFAGLFSRLQVGFKSSPQVSHYSGTRNYWGYVFMAMVELEEAGQTPRKYSRPLLVLCPHVSNRPKWVTWSSPTSREMYCTSCRKNRTVTRQSLQCIILIHAECEELGNASTSHSTRYLIFLLVFI